MPDPSAMLMMVRNMLATMCSKPMATNAAGGQPRHGGMRGARRGRHEEGVDAVQGMSECAFRGGTGRWCSRRRYRRHQLEPGAAWQGLSAREALLPGSNDCFPTCQGQEDADELAGQVTGRVALPDRLQARGAAEQPEQLASAAQHGSTVDHARQELGKPRPLAQFA